MTEFSNILTTHYREGPAEALNEYIIKYANQPQDKYAHLIGICFAQLKKYNEAIAYLNKIKIDSVATLTAKGSVYTHLKKPNNAEKVLTQALKIDPNNPHTHNALGNLNLQRKNFNTASNHFTKACKFAPKIAHYHLNLGISNLGMQMYDQAIAAFSLALDLNENLHTAWQQLALCQEQKMQHLEAINSYQKAIDLHPQYADALHGIGRCFLASNQIDSAIKHLNLCIVQTPEDTDAHHNLATAYYMIGMHNQALKHWHYCNEHNTTLEFLYHIAVCYQNTQKYDHAKSYFSMALKQDKCHLNSILNLAAIALEEHKPDKAAQYYARALKIDPNHTESKFILSALENKNTDHAKAPPSYVENLFDQYANSYDKHLTKGLDYQVPEKLKVLLSEYKNNTFLKTLDIGCGTGLLGPIIRPTTRMLVGIDISGNMIKQAHTKGCYDELIHDDFMQSKDFPYKFDLIVALDVLPYFGDCRDLFEKISKSLNDNGICIISIETFQGVSYKLHNHVRYCHSCEYIKETAVKNKMAVIDWETCNLRKQQRQPVKGAILILKRLPTAACDQ